MANYFNLALDTTGPANPSISLASGATYATAALLTATIGTDDTPTTGYQMKIWGDLDLTWCKSNGIVGTGATAVAESDALWITFATSKQLQLSAADGLKTVYCKIRDDVYNESSQASDTITLDTTRPVVTITGPDVTKISKQPGKKTASFSFVADVVFVEYKVKVVATSGAAENTGTAIPTTAGSTNMSGSAGDYPANTAINCTIEGADLESASAGDGTKIVKVFVKDEAGNWSI